MGRLGSLALLVACAAFHLVGCGGDDDAWPDPMQNCRDFVDAWCNENAECSPPSERAHVNEDCHFVVELDIDCQEARNVSSRFSACMDSIAKSPCISSSSIEFPETCRGILQR
jgi:hypothetical protein